LSLFLCTLMEYQQEMTNVIPSIFISCLEIGSCLPSYKEYRRENLFSNKIPSAFVCFLRTAFYDLAYTRWEHKIECFWIEIKKTIYHFLQTAFLNVLKAELILVKIFDKNRYAKSLNLFLTWRESFRKKDVYGIFDTQTSNIHI